MRGGGLRRWIEREGRKEARIKKVDRRGGRIRGERGRRVKMVDRRRGEIRGIEDKVDKKGKRIRTERMRMRMVER